MATGNALQNRGGHCLENAGTPAAGSRSAELHINPTERHAAWTHQLPNRWCGYEEGPQARGRKTSLIWAHRSLKTLRLFWMKGVLKHHSSEETGRIKTPLERLSFLLSDSPKTTGSISLPLVSPGSSHRCQKTIPRVTLLVLVQSAHVPSEKTSSRSTENYLKGKQSFIYTWAKHKALSLFPFSLDRSFLSSFIFTLEFSFLGSWAGFDSWGRYYWENNKQVSFSFRCLKLSLLFHYKHIQPARSAHSTTWKELQVEVSHSRILLWI